MFTKHKFNLIFMFQYICISRVGPRPRTPFPKDFFRFSPTRTPPRNNSKTPSPDPKKFRGFRGIHPLKCLFFNRNLKKKIKKIPSKFTLPSLFLKEK